MKKSLFFIGLILTCVGIYLISIKYIKIQNTTSNESPKTTTSKPTQTPTPKPVDWTMTAVGDIMLSRNVDAVMHKQTLLYDYPYAKIKQILNSDINFANLETPLIEGKPVPSGTMVFRADPENANALNKAGFNMISLANNHTPNQGQKGLTSTFTALNNANIQYVGAGRDIEETFSPKIIDAKGFKVAFLAYNDSDVVPDSYGAGVNSKNEPWAGTALMSDANLATEISLAKSISDYVIISMHSGTEYTVNPNKRQIDFAHQSIDLGADLVIGHHPHVVQTVEKYKEKYIFYSLGNNIFDQMFSNETRRGLGLRFTFKDSAILHIELIPTVIENYAQPRIANSLEAKWILDRLNFPYYKEGEQYYLTI